MATALADTVDDRTEVAPAAPAAQGALTVSGLTHRLGEVEVLRDVGFRVEPGEVHALVGPSGCGKSTTLRLVAGLEPVQAGVIELRGEIVADARRHVPAERRQVGLMFQDYALFPHLTVRRNVAFGLGRLPRRERDAQVDCWLARVGLAGYGERYPHQLSGGEQQRVALARAMAPRPSLMLLDEAFSNLDTHLREDLRTLVLELLRETRTPTVLVTHDADEAIRVADRMHVMRAGRLVQSGSPAEIYVRPNDLFVCSFFGQASRFKGWAVGGRVSTPLGVVARPDLADGTAVDVVVRPEAARLVAGEGDARATVRAFRDLGPACVAELELADGWRISAHVPAGTAPLPGEEVALVVDRDHIFVFESA
jgi:iron(III) transport system ATP-binding protein